MDEKLKLQILTVACVVGIILVSLFAIVFP